MTKKLLPKNDGVPATTYIQENKAQNFNIENSDVTINLTLSPQSYASGNAEQMYAIQSFSREYYQLIVTCEEDIFRTNVVSVLKNRALTKHNTPDEIFSRCASLSDEGITELKTIPAIICQENTELKGVTMHA